MTCTNWRHDHDDEGRPMVCAHCHEPSHYDYGVEMYVHDDPETPGCWLTISIDSLDDLATPCTTDEHDEAFARRLTAELFPGTGQTGT